MAGVGAYFRTLREKQGITRAWVAEQAGTSETSLYRIESGKQKPGLELMLGIIDAVRGSVADVRALLLNSDAKEEQGRVYAERYLSSFDQTKILAFREDPANHSAVSLAHKVETDPELRRAFIQIVDALRDREDAERTG